MVLIKPFTLLPLAAGTLALTTHEPVGKRDVLVEARRTCTRTGWIPACPGMCVLLCPNSLTSPSLKSADVLTDNP